jgi:hypothetical protein
LKLEPFEKDKTEEEMATASISRRGLLAGAAGAMALGPFARARAGISVEDR